LCELYNKHVNPETILIDIFYETLFMF